VLTLLFMFASECAIRSVQESQEVLKIGKSASRKSVNTTEKNSETLLGTSKRLVCEKMEREPFGHSCSWLVIIMPGGYRNNCKR